MARKSKAFSELIKLQKRKPQLSQNPLASLEKKLRQKLVPFEEIVVSPPGEVKMSEVLEDFVKPYRKEANTKDAMERLLTLAVIAWNAALFKESERQEIINQIITDKIFQGEQKLKAEIKEIVKEMSARKELYFSEYKQMIVDFEVKDVGCGYQIAVASTLSPKSSHSELDFQVGDSIVVKQGVLDPDFGTDISGWQGRISELERQNNLISIDWDSVTLKNIPDAVIDKCEENNLNWARMDLEPTEVELTQPQDTEEDVAATIEQIESQHRWSYLGEEGKGIQAVLAEVDPDDDLAAGEAWKEHLEKVLSFPSVTWRRPNPTRLIIAF